MRANTAWKESIKESIRAAPHRMAKLIEARLYLEQAAVAADSVPGCAALSRVQRGRGQHVHRKVTLRTAQPRSAWHVRQLQTTYGVLTRSTLYMMHVQQCHLPMGISRQLSEWGSQPGAPSAVSQLSVHPGTPQLC